MTPKEKAKDLFKRYNDIMFVPLNPTQKRQYHDFVKESALIAVDEIIKAVPIAPLELSHPLYYWQEVKQEIEKL